jgi:hypothetical protein
MTSSHRWASSIVVYISYGWDLKDDKEDWFVKTAGRNNYFFSLAVEPFMWIVDFIPIRKYLSPTRAKTVDYDVHAYFSQVSPRMDAGDPIPQGSKSISNVGPRNSGRSLLPRETTNGDCHIVFQLPCASLTATFQQDKTTAPSFASHHISQLDPLSGDHDRMEWHVKTTSAAIYGGQHPIRRIYMHMSLNYR